MTIEGLQTRDGVMHAAQSALSDHDAFQCGFCTPGQIMSAVACIREGHVNSDEEIREYRSGNLCRCGAKPDARADRFASSMFGTARTTWSAPAGPGSRRNKFRRKARAEVGRMVLMD